MIYRELEAQVIALLLTDKARLFQLLAPEMTHVWPGIEKTPGVRALLIYNQWDFVRLHHRQPDHAGIIACTEGHDLERQAARIHSAITANQPLRGKLIRVHRP